MFGWQFFKNSVCGEFKDIRNYYIVHAFTDPTILAGWLIREKPTQLHQLKRPNFVNVSKSVKT